MLTKDQLDDLRSCPLAPASGDAANPGFVVVGMNGHADVWLSVSGDVLLDVTRNHPLFPEGRASFSPAQARELCVALLTVAALAEGGSRG